MKFGFSLLPKYFKLYEASLESLTLDGVRRNQGVQLGGNWYSTNYIW
jgi:hypothetical protein